MTVEVTPELLTELETAAGKATQGGWRNTDHIVERWEQPGTGEQGLWVEVLSENPEADAKHIAKARPEVVLALVKRVRELEAGIAVYERAIQAIAAQCEGDSAPGEQLVDELSRELSRDG